MGLGDRITQDHEMVSTLLLYNECLESLDLSFNKLSKLGRVMPSLVRNRCSNLMRLDLSQNEAEIEDFVAMMKSLQPESAFGSLHFKLRLLLLNSNPMMAFDFKIRKILERRPGSSKTYQSKEDESEMLDIGVKFR